MNYPLCDVFPPASDDLPVWWHIREHLRGAHYIVYVHLRCIGSFFVANAIGLSLQCTSLLPGNRSLHDVVTTWTRWAEKSHFVVGPVIESHKRHTCVSQCCRVSNGLFIDVDRDRRRVSSPSFYGYYHVRAFFENDLRLLSEGSLLKNL